MNKAIFAALALALTASAAKAADLPSYKAPPPPPPPPVLSWTGFYGGLNIGVGFYDSNSSNAGLWGWNNRGGSRAGVVGGGQIGYNYQLTPMFVAGVETDFQGTSIGSGAGRDNSGWLFGLPPATTKSLNWFGTVRGRLGVTLLSPQLLVYGTGGFAYGEVQHNGFFQNSAVQTGWTAGGGAEWMFLLLPNWSVKAEYLYTQLSGSNSNNGWWWAFNPGWGLNNVNNRTRFHTVRVGVNYHFNFGAPAPVLAKY